MTSAPQNGIIAGINVTPLVDVTLVLLIIFIVTAKLVVTPAIPLELPRAAQTEDVSRLLGRRSDVTGPTLVDVQAGGERTAAFVALAGAALAKHPRPAGGDQRGRRR